MHFSQSRQLVLHGRRSSRSGQGSVYDVILGVQFYWQLRFLARGGSRLSRLVYLDEEEMVAQPKA